MIGLQLRAVISNAFRATPLLGKLAHADSREVDEEHFRQEFGIVDVLGERREHGCRPNAKRYQ